MKYTSEKLLTYGGKEYVETRSIETDWPTIQLSDGKLYLTAGDKAKAKFRADRVRALRLFCLNHPDKIAYEDWNGSVEWWVKKFWAKPEGRDLADIYAVHTLGLSSTVPGAHQYGVNFKPDPVKALELILEYYGCSVEGEAADIPEDAIKEALPG